MIHFLKLIRTVNLLIIGLTMYSMRFFYYELAHIKVLNSDAIWQERIDFFLLVFSTILIAAAGNIINDYFDVRADRVNKPERLIITKHIKQRWAIINHWMLNGLAFLIGTYLSIRYQTFWYVFIHLISINTLWFYSMFFKRKVLIGNLLIALLTAVVPVLCGIHFYLTAHLDRAYFELMTAQDSIYFSNWIFFMAEHGRFIIAMAIFAFILNIGREIIKDMQDMAGDELLHAKTLPMVIGTKKTSYITALMLLCFPLVSLVLYFAYRPFAMYDFFFFLPLIFSLLIVLAICVLLFRKQESLMLRLFDRSLKVAMFFGLLIPFYWALFR